MNNVLGQRDINRIDAKAKVEVNLDCNQLYQFRHASELTKEAHGGYLIGTIALKNIQTYAEITAIELELVRDVGGAVHPGLLHITPSERKKRETRTGMKKKEPTVACMKVEDHKVILRFERGKILVKHSYFRATDPFDGQGNLDVTSCWDDKKKILTLDSQKLQLTVAKPKQKGEKSTKNSVFVKSVFQEKYKDLDVKPDIEAMEEEYTSKRRGRVSGLHKVHLKATFIFANGLLSISGISPNPMYDKGKYELKGHEICPNVICNEIGHKIRLLVKSSKVTAEVDVVFVLKDAQGEEVARPIKLTKICGFYELHFDQIAKADDYNLHVFIDDVGEVVPESEDFFSLKVVTHSITECVPCISSNMYAGPPPTNADVQLPNVKKRRASKRHSLQNASTSRDDPDSKVAALVLPDDSKVIDHRNVASPANGFLQDLEESPDSGVQSNISEKQTDREMSDVHSYRNENSGNQEISEAQSNVSVFEETNENLTDQDVLVNQDPPLLDVNGALREYAEFAYSPGRIEDCMEFLGEQQITLPESQNPSIILEPLNPDPMWGGSNSQPITVHTNMEPIEMSDSFTDSDWGDLDAEFDSKIVTDGVRKRNIPDTIDTQSRVERISRSVAVQRLTSLKEMFLRNYGLVAVAGCMGAAALCRLFY